MVVMASYALTAAAFLYTIARAFGAQRAPLGVLLRHGHPTLEAIGLLVIAPIIESLFLIAMIELLRWLILPSGYRYRAPRVFQRCYTRLGPMRL